MRSLIFKLLGIAILAVSIGGGWLWMDYQKFTQTPLEMPEDGWIYEVQPGATPRSIAADLRGMRIINKPHYLRWYARQRGVANRIRAGEYRFPVRVTPDEFFAIVTSGKVVQYTLQILEGWTYRQMLREVHAHPVLVHTLTGASDTELLARIGANEKHPEGLFYPDTYSFPKGTTDVDFLKRAYGTLHEQLQKAWDQRAPDLPYVSPYQALIMASIVEKETGVPYERPAIAGVFVRRMQKKMRLQTDPTVIYGMGDAYNGNLRRVDLETETPYNTYRIKGLPPTPIALASKDAILAALNPEPGKTLYFVARGDGAHEFSETLEQHSRAVMKYQVRPNKAKKR